MPPSRSRRDLLLGSIVVVGAAVLLIAIAVGARGVSGQAANQPSPTGVLWSAEYTGWHCQMDENHIVMSDETEVFSLDLRTGERSWSTHIDGLSMGHDCLPDAGLVALTSFRDTDGAPHQDTRLLHGATGEEHSRFPAESATHVLDLGAIVGLVDSNNVLTARDPNAMQSPLWSYRMATPSEVVTHSDVETIDAEFVAVTIGVENDADGIERCVVLRTADGATPPWAPEPTEEGVLFQRHDGVVLRSVGGEAGQQVAALDDAGGELWAQRDTEARVIGGRLYLLDHEDGPTGYNGIRLVDPLTGRTLAQVDAAAERISALPGERIGLISGSEIVSVDADLVNMTREPMANRIFEFADEHHLFIGDFIDGDWERVSAFTTLGEDRVWETDLVPDQRIDRIGPHLVTTDEDSGVIHGLEGPS